ncbi:hypothetical protein [Cytobacillus oceanisediminis]|uniref:hypothetical protein n=1 Tax=Cytobacillus oceanisediminis TaxID=665099 RepID=UPI00203D6D2F|nr:hypothetical protein [Cytobacillus oceanisediminis]MCM3402873.1 hypothetical protein [Cytobacillus oceanisediminis]
MVELFLYIRGRLSSILHKYIYYVWYFMEVSVCTNAVVVMVLDVVVIVVGLVCAVVVVGVDVTTVREVDVALVVTVAEDVVVVVDRVFNKCKAY